MQRIKHAFVSGVALILVASLLTACGGKEERKAKYLEKGKVYLAEKNYEKARIEFKNVLQIDPKSAEGYLYLGQVQEKNQNWSRAFGRYKKAIELDPDLIEPRIRLARFYLAQAGAFRARDDEEGAADAMGLVHEQVKEIQARAPEDLEGLTLEATLWANDGDTDKAVEQLERVIQADPGLESAAALLASLYDQKGRADDAEALLVKATKTSNDPIVLQQRLAQLYHKHEKNDRAEEVLRTLVSNNPTELAYRVSLASFLAQTEQLDKAETVLRDTIAEDPEDTQRYLLLAEFLSAKRDKQAAIDELKQVVQRDPNFTDLQFHLINMYLADGQKEEARALLSGIIDSHGVEPAGLKARIYLAQMIAAEDPESERLNVLIEEVLKENPRDNDALLLRGRLAIREGGYVQAIGDFRSVLKDQPDSAEVLRLLAAAHLANGEPELARDTLMRGVENNPDDADLRLSMARFLVREKKIDAALEQVDAILKADQYNEEALKAKYELLARKGDAAGMEEVTKLMQAGAPEKDEGYILEARLRVAQKEYDTALDILNKVLEKNPDSVQAISAKADVLVEQQKIDEAISMAEKLQLLLPDSGEGYYRKGRLLQQQGDSASAIQQYEIALQKAPESSEVLSALVQLEVGQNDSDKAEKRLLAVLEENPQHRSANELLGAVYLSKKDFVKAEQAFKQQLELTPESAVTYARLAQARAAQDDLAGAAAAYQQGLKVLPGDPQLMIGLAGVHERQKDYEAAISGYEKLLEQQPDNAISINNLAALLSDHRTDAASLDKAVELAAQLERTEQPAFLDTAGWIYYRKGDYARAAEILKAVVEQSPDVPVFQYHLGMTYLKLGDKAAASEHLTRATDGDFVYEGIEEARAALKDL